MSSFSSRRKNRRRRAPGPPPVETQITATALGAAGDGVGEWQGAPVYAPGLLPGETATVRLGPKRGDGRAAIVLERHDASPDRVEPPCPYFAQCGGCSLQHACAQSQIAFKQKTLCEQFQDFANHEVLFDSYDLLASLCRKTGCFEDAIYYNTVAMSHCQNLSYRNDHIYWLYYERALLYGSMNDLEKAIRDLEKGINLLNQAENKTQVIEDRFFSAS